MVECKSETVASTRRQPDSQEFGRLFDAWLHGPTLEARLLTIFSMVGCKISSDEAARVWQKLMKHAAHQVKADVLEQLTRQLILLAPENNMVEQLYVSLLLSRPRQAPSHGIVFMITSCFRYLDKARAVKAALEARGAYARIVVGDPSVMVATEADGITRLPVSDSYEALSYKVLEGLTWVRMTHGSVSVAKVDDDMCFNDDFDPQRLAGVAESLQYAGQVWGGMCDRAWHLGKTSVPTPIYSRRQRGMFAYGPMYLMGPRAVDHLVRSWMFFPGEVAGRFYEDRAIGEMLAEGGFPLMACPIANMGGVVDPTERFISESSDKGAK
jgi:hypothetical protein